MSVTSVVAIDVAKKHKQASGSRYLLPSDRPESERLNLQNRMLKKAFGNIVFAPLKFNEGDAVLDSGTGTACWLLDCYDAFQQGPCVHYYGIDITSNLYPTLDDKLGSRIHLTEGDILRFQGEWTKRPYKLVNQRLLIAALSAEDWKTAIGNFHKVVSPGGWVQLVETEHCYSGKATERHRAVLQRIFEKRGLLLDPVMKIPALLRDAGFVEINTSKVEIDLGEWVGQDGVEARDNFIGVYRGMKRPVVNVMNIMSSADFDSLIEEMEQEWDNIPGSKILFSVFYARKPESV